MEAKDWAKVKSQMQKMDMIKYLQNIQQNWTDHRGLLDKNQFMLRAGLFFMFNIERFESQSYDLFKKVNSCLYKILGKGHNVMSCIAFLTGKKGQDALRESVRELSETKQ